MRNFHCFSHVFASDRTGLQITQDGAAFFIDREGGRASELRQPPYSLASAARSGINNNGGRAGRKVSRS